MFREENTFVMPYSLQSLTPPPFLIIIYEAMWEERDVIPLAKLEQIAAVCLLCGGAALCSLLFANARRECSPAHLTNTHTNNHILRKDDQMCACAHVRPCM